jgi:hypothetical protein
MIVQKKECHLHVKDWEKIRAEKIVQFRWLFEVENDHFERVDCSMVYISNKGMF